MPRRALFRCDASPEIGGGHLVRCRSLAEALRARGWSVGFAMSAGSHAAAAKLREAGHDVRDADGIEDSARRPSEPAADLLVLDHYGIDARVERRLRSSARWVMVLDDLADRDHDADILLDPTFGRSPSDYAARVPESCRLLLGSDFALVRGAYGARREASMARREGDASVERIAVSCGLLDAQDVTGRMLEGLETSGFRGRIDVVLGAGAPHRAAAAARLARTRSRATLHFDPPDLPDIMAGADLALGTLGSTAWERCTLGLPAICAVAADNQAGIASALSKAGALVDLGRYEALDARMIGSAIDSLCADHAARRAMSRAAAAICDGRGLQRVVGVIDPERDGTGAAVTLRPARHEDGEAMYLWQSAPGARRFARTPTAPTRAEHFAWLDAALRDPSRLLNVIERDGTPAGVLRLDRRARESSGAAYEIAIMVAADSQGLGVGRAALAAARRLVPEATIWADIHRDNAASRAMFAAAGYGARDERWFVQERGDAISTGALP